jgi:RNA polymerase sigma factor (sigma-70 family)
MRKHHIDTDEHLIDRFIRGSREEAEASFEILVRRHGPVVLRACRQVFPDAHVAEDAFQEVFLALARNAAKIRDRRFVGSWLREVAKRIAIKKRFRAQRRSLITFGLEDEDAPVSLGHAETTASQNEFQRIVQAEIESLPKLYRKLVHHSYIEEKSCHEVALLMGCPVGTVKGRLYRAREILRERLLERGLTLV